MGSIKMIVGLGNPTKKYSRTRHNVGFWYLNQLIKLYSIKFTLKNNFYGYISHLYFRNEVIHLLLPDTFMNDSGKSVKSVSDFYKIPPHQILIVHDELDLLPGIVKYRHSIGHNGHNGIKSIIRSFGKNNKFYRLSIGIGRPKNRSEIVDFVLSKPDSSDRKLIYQGIKKILKITDLLVNNHNISNIQSELV